MERLLAELDKEDEQAAGEESDFPVMSEGDMDMDEAGLRPKLPTGTYLTYLYFPGRILRRRGGS